MSSHSELIARMTALRRTIRRRLIGYGLCAVLAGGVAAFLMIVALDWMLGLPWLLRVLVAVFFFAGFAAATLRWIIRPLRAPLTLDEIAGKLEHHFPDLRDRLSSAVNFAQQGDPGSVQMVQQVIRRTEEAVRTVPLRMALSVRPLVVRIVWLIAGAAALTGVFAVAPGWVRTGFYRYIHPLGEIEWPRTVSIVPITGDLTAAVGESVTVRMKVQRGLTDTLRGLVHLRESDGSKTSLTMQPEPGGAFSATVDAVTRDVTYWFEAGDDSTKRRARTIRVVPRPEVLDAVATIEPPDYAPDHPARVQELGTGPLTATLGSRVRVTVRTSKPVRETTPDAPVGLQFEDGSLVPLVSIDETDTELETGFALTGDVAFRVALRDENGLENRGPVTYAIRAVPDQPPVVSMIEPQALTEVTPVGVVRVSARIVDDFSVTAVALLAERLSGKRVFRASMSDGMRTTSTPDGAEAVTTYAWSLEPLNLAPGDLLVFFVEAVDNFRSETLGGQIGRSSPMRLKVISESEFEVRLRSDMAVLESRLRRLALEQGDLLDRTETIRADAERGEALSESRRLSVSQSAADQMRLTRPMRELGQRFEQLAGRMRRNRVGEEDARERVAALGEALRSLAGGAISRAVAALQRAAETSDLGHQAEALTDARARQQEVLDELQSLIQSLARWGSFQGLVMRAQDLLDRQDALRTRTGELGRKTLGKPVDSLTADEAADLKRAEREQEQIAGEAEQFIQRMLQVRDSSVEQDPSAVDAIDAAVRAARANDLTKRLRGAAAAVGENRTAAAMVEQKAATRALQRMMAALEEREDRALAELRKRLTRAEEQIALLIEDQEALRAATVEAGLIGVDASGFAPLEEAQGRLRGNTESLAGDLADAERTAVVARGVRDASENMGEAVVHLRDAEAEPSTAAQDRALERLREAYDRLQRLAQDAANEAFRRTLAQIREDLENIRAAQIEVNGRIAELRADVDRLGRLGRTQVREAARLSRSQGDVRTLVDEVLPELEKVVVYRWALERVSGWMERNQTSLYERRVDDELVATATRIVAEIDKLLGAIVQTEALPMNTDFIESASGAGGEGDVMSTKPVPTVAELLVLKAFQVDINERTRKLSESIDPQNPTEAGLRRLKTVGEDQAEVRRLSELVTKRARQP